MESQQAFTPEVFETLIICVTILIAFITIAYAIVKSIKITKTKEVEKIKLDYEHQITKRQWAVEDRANADTERDLKRQWLLDDRSHDNEERNHRWAMDFLKLYYNSRSK